MSHSSPEKRCDGTRQRLIITALQLFAAEGVNAISLRKITDQSGAQNKSAVHYHFKNKSGLVTAVIEHIAEKLQPLRQQALRDLDDATAPSVRDILQAAYSPFLTLYAESEQGVMAIRLLARLTWESGAEGQALLTGVFSDYLQDIDQHLAAALPEKSRHALRLHITLNLGNLLHGLTDLGILRRLPWAEPADFYRENPAALMQDFFDYLCAGVSAQALPVVQTPPAA